jgi:hypothetical protein
MTSLPDNRIERDGARVDPMLPVYSDRCRCPTCGEYFASTAAFDRHRTGDFGSERRCRDEWEMIEAGMTRASAGHWITRPRLQRPRPAEPVPHHAGAEIDRQQDLGSPQDLRGSDVREQRSNVTDQAR